MDQLIRRGKLEQDPVRKVEDVPEQLPAQSPRNEDPFKSTFEISIPANLREGIDDWGGEQKHQVWMYHIREALVATEQGERFAWVPQAIEAFLRRHHGMEGTITLFESMAISPELGAIRITTLNGVVDLRLDKLEPYSVERELEKVGAPPALDDKAYSTDMQSAVSQLSDPARYRWDLITQAAQYQAQHPDGDLTVRGVRPLGSDFFVSGEGVGVFIKHGPGRDGWAAIKVVLDDVPMTQREKKFIAAADEFSGNYFCSKSAEQARQVLHWINLLIRQGQDIDISDPPDWFKNARVNILKRLLPEHHHVILDNIEQIQSKFGAHRKKFFEITCDVRNYIYTEKGKYHADHPLECIELPDELLKKMSDARTALGELLNEVREFISTYGERIQKLIPVAEDLDEEQGRVGKEHLRYVLDVVNGQRKLLSLDKEDKPQIYSK